MWLGDYPEDHATVTCLFTTHSSTGAPVAPSSGFETADVAIFKNGSATEKTSTNGLTMTSAFNGTTGLHCLVIDTSNDTGDGGFWVAGAVYTIVLNPDETVDSVAVAKVVGQFGIQLYGAARSGEAMTLTAGERNSVADALLDRSNAIETGVTLRGLLRLCGAVWAGKVSGAGTGTETFRNTVADSKDRIVATVDGNGNRTAITTDQT